MAESKIINTETKAINITHSKSSIAGWVGRVTMLFIGALMLITGALMCLTIILILPGFGLCMWGFGLMLVGFGRQKISCPNCGGKLYVNNLAQSIRCNRCKGKIVVNWIKSVK